MHYLKTRIRQMAGCAVFALTSVQSAQAVTVDLLVTYDDATNRHFNGQVDTAMRSWVDQINGIYRNSQIDVQLRLAGTMYYNIGGADMGQVLGSIRVDGNIARKRDEVGADMVTQLHATGSCGLGYVAVSRDWAFNVVGPGCGAQVLAHELGHNMGLSHSRKQGDQGGARYAYALGHGVDGVFATTMAYPGVFNTNWLPTFSNPNTSCNGLPCGIPEGHPQQADGAKAINNVRGELASFKPTMFVDGNTDTLAAGQMLRAGQSLVSRSGRFRVSMQTDGNLVVYNPTRALWASGTYRSDANLLAMQTDGNLVLYGPSGSRWASNTWKSPANKLVMQDDGNLVMYGPTGPVWATNTVDRSIVIDRLNAGQPLNAGQSLFSQNGRYRLSMQTDGNLVIYNPSAPIWASGTYRTDTNTLVMQTDGNLVMYGPGGPRWASNTWKSPANSVVLQDDGNLVMYGPAGAIWASNTVGR